jgi:hypothetical protein
MKLQDAWNKYREWSRRHQDFCSGLTLTGLVLILLGLILLLAGI